MSENSDASPVEIRRLTVKDLMLWRHVRLEALRDTPDAFGSTYESESILDCAGWQAKWENWTAPPGGAVWAAVSGDSAVGVVGCVSDQDQAERAWLISMWVSPTTRRCGIGRALIENAIAWARSRGLRELRLEVTSGNSAALNLYERIGFRLTGGSVAHPRKSYLCEHEMLMTL